MYTIIIEKDGKTQTRNIKEVDVKWYYKYYNVLDLTKL